MFGNQETYADYRITYIDNNGIEQQAVIMCHYMRQEECFKEEYKGEYKEIIKTEFLGFLLS